MCHLDSLYSGWGMRLFALVDVGTEGVIWRQDCCLLAWLSLYRLNATQWLIISPSGFHSCDHCEIFSLGCKMSEKWELKFRVRFSLKLLQVWKWSFVVNTFGVRRLDSVILYSYSSKTFFFLKAYLVFLFSTAQNSSVGANWQLNWQLNLPECCLWSQYESILRHVALQKLLSCGLEIFTDTLSPAWHIYCLWKTIFYSINLYKVG